MAFRELCSAHVLKFRFSVPKSTSQARPEPYLESLAVIFGLIFVVGKVVYWVLKALGIEF